MIRTIVLASLLAVSGAGLPVAAQAPPGVIIVAPPPLRPEVVPPPRDGFAWVAGHWEWRRGRHEWVAGYWVKGRPGYDYEGPRWIERNGRWTMLSGRWVRTGTGSAAVRGEQGERERSAPPLTGERRAAP